MDNLTVVIRTSGERTESVCRKLLEEQVPTDCITLVQEAPFFRSLQRTLEIARSAGRKWTLVVDADLLIRHNAIVDLLGFAESMERNVLFLSGWCMDKLLCCCRPAGLHLYRTEFVDDRLLGILSTVETSLRPEHDLIELAEKRLGRLAAVMPPDPLCLHDHEQFFADVYRKAFVHARKHAEEVQLLLPVWSALGQSDLDYRIAVFGVRASQAWPDQIQMDVRVLPREVGPLLAMMGTGEKCKLLSDGWTGERVRSCIQEMRENYSVPLLERRTGFRASTGILRKWRDIQGTLGTVNGLFWLAGSRMKKWGGILMSRAEKVAAQKKME